MLQSFEEAGVSLRCRRHQQLSSYGTAAAFQSIPSSRALAGPFSTSFLRVRAPDTSNPFLPTHRPSPGKEGTRQGCCERVCVSQRSCSALTLRSRLSSGPAVRFLRERRWACMGDHEHALMQCSRVSYRTGRGSSSPCNVQAYDSIVQVRVKVPRVPPSWHATAGRAAAGSQSR